MRRDRLLEPQRIGVVGGGPAGAICAIQLRRLAAARGRDVEVLVFDRKDFHVAGPRHCNMCAGIISDGLIRKLEGIGIRVPRDAVQRSIQSYTLVVPGAAVRLQRPMGSRIYTAFRSGGPLCLVAGQRRGLDEFLLQTAEQSGVIHLPRLVREVRLPAVRDGPVVLVDSEGDEHPMDAVVGAFGVNSSTAALFEALGFGYRRPRTARAAQCEVPYDALEADGAWADDVKVLSLGIPGVAIAALVPKTSHITVSLIGRDVREEHLERFLGHKEVRALLDQGHATSRRCCLCRPRLPVGAGRNVVADRVVMIGDAHTSRYLKNGLDSAFVTASLAAEALLSGGASRANLMAGYVDPCRALFYRDNKWGWLMLAGHHAQGRVPWLARAQIDAAQRELAGSRRPRLNSALWGLLTGDEPYRDLFRRALHPRVSFEIGRSVGRAVLRRRGPQWPAGVAPEGLGGESER